MRRSLLSTTLLAIAVAAALLLPARATAQSNLADFDLPVPFGGHFYTQTDAGATGTGFAVSNADNIPFWTYFQQAGGIQAVGYPVSHRFVYKGFVVQAFQKVVFQWRPEVNTVYYLNTLDEMHNAGLDGFLQSVRQTPPPSDWSGDTGLPFSQVMQRHLALLDANPAIKTAFYAEPDWLNRNGLPMAPIQNMGGVLVLRAQRKVYQQWLTTVPWAAAGQVVTANGGDLAKEGGLFQSNAVTPLPAVSAPLSALPATTPVAPTPSPTGGCAGDEQMSFNPPNPQPGQQVAISVTSATALANVGLSGPFSPAYTGVQQGGKGYIWSWTVAPNTTGRADYNFTVNNGATICTSNFMVVGGAASGCNGDEQMSFNPAFPAVGQQVTISVTSARPSTNIGLNGPFNPAFQGVQSGGFGTIWNWTVTPNSTGTFGYNFTIDNGASICTANSLQVGGGQASGCNGDEQMTFNPAVAAVGQPVTISVTSARPSVNVGLSGPFNPVAAGIQTGGKGYIWSWTVTPSSPGQYNYNFTVNNGASVCTANTLPVNGSSPGGQAISIDQPKQGASVIGSVGVVGHVAVTPSSGRVTYNIYGSNGQLVSSGTTPVFGSPGSSGSFNTTLGLSRSWGSPLRIEIVDSSGGASASVTVNNLTQ